MRDLVYLMAKPFLVVLLVFSLAASVFAHSGPNLKEAQLQTYLLSGGEVSALCGDSKTPGTVHKVDCPACQIASNLLAPPVTGFAQRLELRHVAEVVAPRESRATRAVLNIAHGLRAPPQA